MQFSTKYNLGQKLTAFREKLPRYIEYQQVTISSIHPSIWNKNCQIDTYFCYNYKKELIILNEDHLCTNIKTLSATNIFGKKLNIKWKLENKTFTRC